MSSQKALQLSDTKTNMSLEVTLDHCALHNEGVIDLPFKQIKGSLLNSVSKVYHKIDQGLNQLVSTRTSELTWVHPTVTFCL